MRCCSHLFLKYPFSHAGCRLASCIEIAGPLRNQIVNPHLIHSRSNSKHPTSQHIYFFSSGFSVFSAGAASGATAGSSLGSALKSGLSSSGPLVALMPGAGFVVGIAGGSSAAGAGAGVSVGLASAGFCSVGALVVGG